VDAKLRRYTHLCKRKANLNEIFSNFVF
jgi:hypothetical protein